MGGAWFEDSFGDPDSCDVDKIVELAVKTVSDQLFIHERPYRIFSNIQKVDKYLIFCTCSFLCLPVLLCHPTIDLFTRSRLKWHQNVDLFLEKWIWGARRVDEWWRWMNDECRWLMNDGAQKIWYVVCEGVESWGACTQMHLPSLHGAKDTPSGLFSSEEERPLGSLTAGTPDRMQALVSRAFRILCLVEQPALLLHDRPCVNPQNIAPHGQMCGVQRFETNLRPVTTLMVSLSCRNPQEPTGVAFSQSPLWAGAWDAKSLALLMLSEQQYSQSITDWYLVPWLLFSNDLG